MRSNVRWLVALGALVLSTACGVPDEGPWMRPGEDCISCHRAGGEASDRVWTAAGTVYDLEGNAVEGAKILITDAEGRAVTLTSNGAGNFYTAEPLKEPFRQVSAGRNEKYQHMSGVPGASCNSCHFAGGAAGRTIFVE